MTYEGFVYVLYQDDGNWSIDQITATINLQKVRYWIEMTFGSMMDSAEVDWWITKIEKLKITEGLAVTDGEKYLHIRKVNPERK